MAASFIHVLLSRCQEFCQASHCSVNLVPVKHSVSISLVKHYCQATGGTEREGKGWKRGGEDGEEELLLLPFILSSLNKHGLLPKGVQEESRAIKTVRGGGGRSETEDESDEEERWKWRRGVLEETEYLCAEQKGVQSIILRQADRAVWGVYFYLNMEVCGSATAAW